MADYYKRIDLASVTSFSDPLAEFDFKFVATEQAVFNESDKTAVFEASFDGKEPHATLQPTGPTKALGWSDHVRNRVWVRRVDGVGGGPFFVQVLANTR